MSLASRISPSLSSCACSTRQSLFSYSHSSTPPVLGLLRAQNQQKRYAKVLDVRFLQTHTEPRIADKYKQLLEQKAKSEGLSSVDELKEAYKSKIQDYKRKSAAPPVLPGKLNHDGVNPSSTSINNESSLSTAETTMTTTSPSTAPKAPSAAKPKTNIPPVSSGIKTLSSYIDTDKILAHDQKEIELIWRARHVEDKNSLCAVIPYDTYHRIETVAKKHPMFILPLPRPNQGIEMHFLQWQFTAPQSVNVMFTSLVEYKLKGEYASPHTTITHHLDIVPQKDLVLLHGQVMEDRGVSVDEAKWLLMALQKFYGAGEGESTESSSRRELLRMFSEGRTDFDVGRLIQEVETIN